MNQTFTTLLLFFLPLHALLAEAWFSNRAIELGLSTEDAYLIQWIDLNGDGWEDVLVMSRDGLSRAAHELDSFGKKGFLLEEDSASFPLDEVPQESWLRAADQNGDENLSLSEIKAEARKHQWRAYLSTQGQNGRTFTPLENLGLYGYAFFAIGGDVDNDGDVDLLTGGYDAAHPSEKVDAPPTIWLNDGAGHFSTISPFALSNCDLDKHWTTICGASFLDVNRDGILDLYTGSWYKTFGNGVDSYPDRLYLGNGDGTFKDISSAAGMDMDKSRIDVLTRRVNSTEDLTEEERQKIGRFSHRPTYGTGVMDWNNDGLVDLFSMSYGRQWNLQWKNEGNLQFKEIANDTNFDGDDIEHGEYPAFTNRLPEIPHRANGNTFSIAFGDYDNDLDMDLILSEYTHMWAGDSSDITEILTNTGVENNFKFARLPEQKLERVHTIRNWNHGDMGVAWSDLDNDGWLDLIIASHVYPDRQKLEIYHQNPADHTFSRISEEILLDWDDSTQISLADYDQDGDVDILSGSLVHEERMKQRSAFDEFSAIALFENLIGNENNWLHVRLSSSAPQHNASAIGAKVIVWTNGIPQTRVAEGGRGHLGLQDSFTLHFGLGNKQTIERVEIFWNDAAQTKQVLSDVPINQRLNITYQP